MGLHRIRVQQHLAPAAQRHAGGADTTGKGAYFSALNACCPAAISLSISLHAAMFTANIARPRLAPAEKFDPSL